jgi:uncharacterized protein (DUF849 family)
MKRPPKITVAPNGARLQKTDHAGLPLSTNELAETAHACRDAGADAIHLHVRDGQGRHSLDVDLYRTAISALSAAAPDIEIQVTPESAGIYEVPAQLELLRALKPRAASIALREIARAPELVAQVYATALLHGTRVQHILYSAGCLDLLLAWQASGVVPEDMRDAILVLGQYEPPCAGKPDDLLPLIVRTQEAGLRMSVCAFGAQEQACLLAAARLGCDLRVGFENNRISPEGAVWGNNAEAVSSLTKACAEFHEGCEL